MLWTNIFAGFGGQGVLLIGQLLAYAGMYEGKNVSWLPSYGPEMRGGTANCSVVVSDEPVASPVINKCDCVIAMNRPSLDKFEQNVLPGGKLFINSSIIDKRQPARYRCLLRALQRNCRQAQQPQSCKHGNARCVP